jgi:hypothetical protein
MNIFSENWADDLSEALMKMALSRRLSLLIKQRMEIDEEIKKITSLLNKGSGESERD